jgi:hypothetical protein
MFTSLVLRISQIQHRRIVVQKVFVFHEKILLKDSKTTEKSFQYSQKYRESLHQKLMEAQYFPMVEDKPLEQ